MEAERGLVTRSAPMPEDEEGRLRALLAYDVLDSEPEQEFDDIAQVAAQVCGTPIAVVSLIDAERQWFKCRVGLTDTETSRDVAFCAHAIVTPDEVMVVPDTLADPRFADNPSVVSDPKVRFYAGAPMVTPDGHALGTVCVVDRVPRHLDADQLGSLRALARQAVARLELRRSLRRLMADARRAGLRPELGEVAAEVAAAFRHAPYGLAVTTPDGTLVRVNEAFCDMVGLPEERLLGQPAETVTHPDDPSDHAALRHRLLAGEAANFLRERRYLRPDGEIRLARVAVSLIRDPDGAPLYLLTQAEDITSRRLVEDALLETQLAVDAIVASDWQGRITSWNLGAERMFGYRRSEVLGEAVTIIIPPRLREAHRQGMARLADGGAPRLLDAVVPVTALRRDGREFPVELSLTRWGAATRPSYCAMIRDVTDLHEARESVRESQRRLATLMSNLPGMAYRCAHRPGWPMEFVSEGCAGLTGYEAEELTGTDAGRYDRLIDDDDRWRRAAKIEEGLRSGEPFQVTYRIRKASGSGTWVWEQGRGVYDRHGEVLAVEGFVADVTQFKQAENRLARAALYDPLTRLANRAHLGQLLDEALTRSRSLGLVLLDLDGLGLINQSMGHEVGDALLVAMAQRLQEHCRRPEEGPSDVVARMGSDEFAVLCHGLDGPEELLEIGRRLLLAAREPVPLPEGTLQLGATAGVVTACGQADATTLLRDADTALQRAKASGRGQILLFDGAMRQDAVRRLHIANALHGAQQRGELRLVYQPVIRLENGAPVGVEALLRWQHPQLGDVSPSLFVPVAEHSGVIERIGAWVLRQACAQLAAWSREDPALSALQVAVNLSVRQLHDPDLPSQLRTALQDSGLTPGRLVVEVTETVLMNDVAATAAALRELRALGVRVAVDDFGTGYSSLAYLQHLPLDVLKIDRSFVDGLLAPERGPVVTAIVQLGRALGLQLVGEGVELAEQARALAELGCEFAQGYYFARPLEAGAVPGWLTKPRSGSQATTGASRRSEP